jgi:transcriptional regulator with XRE-family HTH domain
MALDTFRDRLIHAREARGLSTRQLGGAARLSTGSVSALEVREAPDPRLSTVVVLAAALEVPPAWLAFGEGPSGL